MYEKIEIVEWVPTPEMRWYAPNSELMPLKLQRQFDCTARDGSTGKIWAEVHQNSPFCRVFVRPNVELSGLRGF